MNQITFAVWWSEMQLTKHSKSNKRKTLSFQVSHCKDLQLKYLNLQWTMSISENKHFYSYAVLCYYFCFLPAMQIQLGDCIFIPREAARLCLWHTELKICYFGCLFLVRHSGIVFIKKQFQALFLHSLQLSLIIYESELKYQTAVQSFCW